ncbi:basic proline-rich protein-like protein [Lates japonicus]|uniref:Basic proline-rich protein-like protein n=1 Tax=Lates japonicus TaxID=270547 RepID=A0AAD3ME62_LATJO|nr:basic proline-rich protein-like protein [Lates japonicus]GLD57816.1 basic proline-rich protein-like protein [Lates japonicus]GLD71212.1 basic proline-rich protein-like protein [Lates japonicus]GLD71218.1 basic proline-rich protein-like protein [Lates japonicus]GLD72625.1 basic proline-rich protein-like protein [Lates japonicus]
MFNCCSHGTLLHFGLQSSRLNICYYHQDLHPRRLHPGPRPRLPCSPRRPSYSSRRSPRGSCCRRRPGMGPTLQRHPFSGLVDSAAPVLLTKSGPLGGSHSTPGSKPASRASYPFKFTIFRVLSHALTLHLPDGAGETGRWCARSPAGPGSHLSRRAPALTFIAPRGLLHPLTRACVRLLGPCFKTGRVGCRHRRRPLTPFTWAGPRPGGATRLGRTEDSPPRSTVAPGARGPRPSPRGERAQRALSPRPREAARYGRGVAVKLAAGAASHLRPEPFQADLEPVAAHHRRRKCARRGPASAGERSREGILPHRAAVPDPPS